MIEVVAKNPDTVALRVTARRLAAYLDNCAIVALAKGRTGLREGFLRALQNGADVLFSVTNASEIVGPTGASQDAVREFFTAIGPHWIPIQGPSISRSPGRGIAAAVPAAHHGCARCSGWCALSEVEKIGESSMPRLS